MGWNSETLVVAAPKEQLEALWGRVHETYEEAQAAEERYAALLEDRRRRNIPEDPFCCFFLSGRCSFGARCRFSHAGVVTAEEIGRRGCNKRFDCRFGHNDRQDDFMPKLPAFEINDSLQDYGFTSKLTHMGPNYSIDDPLWLEASAALKSLGSICVQEFVPEEDDTQRVTWMLCTSPTLLLQSLEGPDGERLRADQRKGARQKLSAVHKGQQQVFRKRCPRRAEPLRQAASQACAQLPRELPAHGVPASAWEALDASLAQCSDAVESFWRASNGDENDSDEYDSYGDDYDLYRNRGSYGMGERFADEVRELWQRVMEAQEAVGCLAGGSVAPAGGAASAPEAGTSLDAVAEWLASEGFGAHATSFRSEGIDARALRLLTEEHLQRLGVARLGDRLNLLEAVSARAPPLGGGPDAHPAAQQATASSPPKCFLELVRQAVRLSDGAVLVRHWVPGGVG
uniref:C3H1-type domain-containing protein n=1 Tax=Pyrodinium bahamense TaxID=73915 RepID=A0A7S0B9P9_9DINO|mmetsp:Transcript_6682/g.18288  ORF Transcript_6682/g.18288 Transcript_6682/m.18288 type:complete len:457 (+) Transcript_6682:56-1426(+)